MNSTLKGVAVLAALFGSLPAVADEAGGSGTSVAEAVGGAFATDWSKDFAVSVGTKLWINEWNTWNGDTVLTDPGDVVDLGAGGFALVNPTLESELTSHTSSEQVVPIPVVSVKWKDLFVSGSYFSNTDYNFPSLGSARSASNYQWDANVGYYVLPPYFALTAGYKEVDQKFAGTKFGFSGPTVGFVGAVPMKWGFSLYTNFAYGFFEAQSKAFDSNRNSAYWLIEGGVAYTYNLKEVWAHSLVNSATLQAGYRHQQIETEDIVDSGPAKHDTGNDIMRGMVVGLNFAF